MPTLRVITSSSQRRLLEACAVTISSSPLPPLGKESIAILSNGMARWISMELASRLGVSAGIEYCFPNDLLDRCFNAVLPESPASSPFTRDSLTWRIASHLPLLSRQPGFEQVASYLGYSQDDRRLLQFSRSLADCFDQYIIFRPEMIMSWDEGADDHWQARLWRAVSSGITGNHRAALLGAVQRHVSSGAPPHGKLPRRISLFGISYLPPFHLEALQLLSNYCDVTCYLLNPCGLYWGTIISEKRKSRLALQSRALEAEEYYDTGNPLLSSLGTMGQEFFESVLEHGFEEEVLDVIPEEHVPATSLLATVQSDILTLFDRPSSAARHAVSAQDRSLQIHSCHGPLREMEILYDQLLSCFDELADLEPRHIVVMIPDIETYAPYISSVFNSRSTGRPPLPVTISDRSMRRESPFIEAFFKILDLAASRYAFQDMVNLLESKVVMGCFEISEGELDSIRTWLADCNVRWGRDAGHRTELGFPEYHDFSWQAGLDKLLLGYAMTPDDSATFCGILPYPACSGRQAEAVGKLSEFIARFRETTAPLNARHTLPEWADLLTETIDLLLLPDETDSAGPLALAKALNSLRDACTRFGFTQAITLDAVKDHLAEAVAGSGGGYGFMGGAITFCAMLPMRSIPMRVIWLAGMNDGQFPRTERQPGFSRMNGARRRGDRSLRDEDRYLFLEALMAAEERFCISYHGQDDRDNSTIPPSVLVAELIDYVSRGFVQDDGITPLVPRICHRLQGFSPFYFDGHDPRHLFCYDRELCQAVEASRVSGRLPREFMTEPLPFAATTTVQITLPQLARFLANPAAAFLEQRLGVKLFNPAEEPDDTEPFALDSLANYKLAQELVGRMLDGADYEQCFSAARSRGDLPPLSAGRAAFDAVWAKSRTFTTALLPRLGTLLEPLSITFTRNNVELSALLENCRSDVHVRWRCATMKGKDRISIWLEHLLLNSAPTEGYPLRSILVASDTILELPPVANAAALLADLLEIYCEGMRRPIPFFPETSWAFLQGGHQKAETSWRGAQWGGGRGECENQAVALCFGDGEPWGDDFNSLAERIYGPLVALMK